MAIITPLQKPHKDPTLPYNYRLISLLDRMGKLLEKLTHELDSAASTIDHHAAKYIRYIGYLLQNLIMKI
jgi:hypothetical protein